jgi:hypothetical protein
MVHTAPIRQKILVEGSKSRFCIESCTLHSLAEVTGVTFSQVHYLPVGRVSQAHSDRKALEASNPPGPGGSSDSGSIAGSATKRRLIPVETACGWGHRAELLTPP